MGTGGRAILALNDMKCAALLAVVLAFSGAPAAAMACALECRPEAAADHAGHHTGAAHGEHATADSRSGAVVAVHDCAHDPAVIRVIEPAHKAPRAPIVPAHAAYSTAAAPGASRALSAVRWMIAPDGAPTRSPLISVLRI
jgi:hypothetical protein